MVEKYCKCGHSKISHKKKPESQLSFVTYCRKCNCNEYMNRKLPNLISKVTFIIAVIVIGIFSSLTIMIINYVYSASFTEKWTMPVENITMGDYLVILTAFLIIMNLILLIVLDSCLLGFFRERRRISHTLSLDNNSEGEKT